MSKRCHNFGTKHFKEKSLFHARIALKSLILLFVRLIARGARIGKTHTQTHRHTDRTSTVTFAHAHRGLMKCTKVHNLQQFLYCICACVHVHTFQSQLVTCYSLATCTRVAHRKREHPMSHTCNGMYMEIAGLVNEREN